jgi:predicted SprT family Zn-dependent metalloprotease
MAKKMTPTNQTYPGLERAYRHFNARLFAGKLPPCLITMTRQKGALGYFSGNRFAAYTDAATVTDEIALNPSHFAERSPAAILSTLVHEMVHLWQHHFGKPSRATYHNSEWAATMVKVGLIPTDTGDAEGKMTGQKMTHIIEPGGRFDRACAAFLKNGDPMLYQDRAGDPVKARKKAASKTKYTCPACELNAWAKPEANLRCGDCGEAMEAEDVDAEAEAEEAA